MNRCEDFPCCGHEANDCDGTLYGNDEAIKADVELHFDCDHEFGWCEVDGPMMRMRGEGAYYA